MIEGTSKQTQLWVIRVDLERGIASPQNAFGGSFVVALGSPEDPTVAFGATFPLPEDRPELEAALAALESALENVAAETVFREHAPVRPSGLLAPESPGVLPGVDRGNLAAEMNEIRFDT